MEQMYECVRAILLRFNSKSTHYKTFFKISFYFLNILEAVKLWHMKQEFVGLVEILDTNIKQQFIIEDEINGEKNLNLSMKKPTIIILLWTATLDLSFVHVRCRRHSIGVYHVGV